jgi:hypothetical protein
MRTTLNIDDDVLQAAKDMARRQGVTVGQIIPALARRSLIGAIGDQPTLIRNGVPVLPPRGEIITLEWLQGIMDSEAV